MIKMFEQYVTSRSILCSMNETFITNVNDIKGKNLDTYNKLKFKMGDLVVLTKAYFDKSYVYNEDEPMDLDRLEDNNSIFKIEYINMDEKNDGVSFYIRDINDISQKLITNNVAWVTDEEIELCPQWRLDAQNYNL